MKRQLIETQRELLIQCDNTACGYSISYTPNLQKDMIHFVDMPCPDCKENLLTKEDFLMEQKLIKTIDWINKYFSWITIFYSKKAKVNATVVSVHVYYGVKIKTEKP